MNWTDTKTVRSTVPHHTCDLCKLGLSGPTEESISCHDMEGGGLLQLNRIEKGCHLLEESTVVSGRKWRGGGGRITASQQLRKKGPKST